MNVWLTWGCRGSVSWSQMDTDHRSDAQMLPDRHLLTAPLSLCVSASHLKPRLSSERTAAFTTNYSHHVYICPFPLSFTSEWKNSRFHLLWAPVCQCPQMCQHTRVGEVYVLQLSLSQLSHHRAQSQHLICPQLSHRTEGLERVKNHRQKELFSFTQLSVSAII